MSEYVTEWVDDLPGMTPGEEIVRCRDCRYYEHEVFTFGECKEETHYCWRDWNGEPVAVYVEPEGFCAWGERRDA